MKLNIKQQNESINNRCHLTDILMDIEIKEKEKECLTQRYNYILILDKNYTQFNTIYKLCAR